jgi:hypothetical protein
VLTDRSAVYQPNMPAICCAESATNIATHQTANFKSVSAAVWQPKFAAVYTTHSSAISTALRMPNSPAQPTAFADTFWSTDRTAFSMPFAATHGESDVTAECTTYQQTHERYPDKAACQQALFSAVRATSDEPHDTTVCCAKLAADSRSVKTALSAPFDPAIQCT